MDGTYERVLSSRLHQTQRRPSPHRSLLALLAISRLLEFGRRAVPWSLTQDRSADLLSGFGSASTTGCKPSFTRMRMNYDDVWQFDDDPTDNVSPQPSRCTGTTRSPQGHRNRRVNAIPG